MVLTRRKKVWLWSGILAIGALAITVSSPELSLYGQPKFGPFTPRIIDGDTLADGRTVFRLAGIDTCEKGQPAVFPDYAEPLDCGAIAAEFVRRFIADRPVVCYDQGGRTYGRIVARCFIADDTPSLDTDIGAFALRSGWAFVTSYAEPAYAAQYQYLNVRARLDRNGIWNGKVENPADWRHRK